jgi:hypothetical protein
MQDTIRCIYNFHSRSLEYCQHLIEGRQKSRRMRRVRGKGGKGGGGGRRFCNNRSIAVITEH